MNRAVINSRAGPSGGGGMGMKLRNMFKPKVTKISPSKTREMMVAVFILLFSVFWFVSGENSRSCDFQNNLAVRVSGLAQFMSTPGICQWKDSSNNGLHFAVVD